MKIGIRSLLAVAILALSFSKADAALVAGWTFGSDSSNPYTADSQAAGISSASLNVAPNGANATLNYLTSGGNPGAYISITGHGQNINGSTLTFTLTANNANIALSSFTFDYYRLTANGPTTISWSYSISGGGGSGTLASSSLGSSGSWAAVSPENLAAITFSSGQTLTLVGTISGAASGSGREIRFDNFMLNGGITPVPEPANLALAGFGLLFALGGARRYFRRQAAE